MVKISESTHTTLHSIALAQLINNNHFFINEIGTIPYPFVQEKQINDSVHIHSKHKYFANNDK